MTRSSSTRSRVKQWCRQFRGLVDRFSYTRYDFVDPSLVGQDGRLMPVSSWYQSQPVPVGYDEHEQGFVDAERVA